MKPTNVHVDEILSNMSIKYKNGKYIAEQVFPYVRVDKQSDKFYVFGKGDWFRNSAAKRAPGSVSLGGGFSLSTDSYYCEEIAFHTLLTDEDRDNADIVLNLERNKVDFATEKILIAQEVEVASFVQTASNWANTVAIANKWSDYDLSDPLANIETAKGTVEDNTGQEVNTLVMSSAVWNALKHHPQILDRLPVTGLKTATLDSVKALTEIPNILIGKALVNTAKEGQADVFSPIWSATVWVGHVASSPAKETPSAGYIFTWYREGKLRGVRRWRDEDSHSEKIEAFQNYGTKVTGNDLGYTMTGVV